MKTVTSFGNNFISVAILPTNTPDISYVVNPVAFSLHTVCHVEIADILEKLIAMRNCRKDYFTEITIEVNDNLYGNIKFHKYDHSYVAIVSNHCSTKFFGELNLLKPVVKQLRTWIQKHATYNQ